MYEQTGSRSHRTPRQHCIVEARNAYCGHMKRDDPKSRRFIQYLAMESSKLVLLVRDVKTGKFVVQPPDDERWLMRQKVGMGRASKASWEIVKAVDEQFLEMVDKKHRQWHFDGFVDYYDIIIWDLEPGGHASWLYNAIMAKLYKAHRLTSADDLWTDVAPILDTLVRDQETGRTRTKKSDQEESLLQYIKSSQTQRIFMDPVTGKTQTHIPEEMAYTDTDRLEDEILFPWENEVGDRPSNVTDLELKTNEVTSLLRESGIHQLEKGPDFMRFVHDLDSDDDFDEHGNIFTKENDSGMTSSSGYDSEGKYLEDYGDDDDSDSGGDHDDDDAEISSDDDLSYEHGLPENSRSIAKRGAGPVSYYHHL